MDSGNSGSLQSSSGEEEYDSRPSAPATDSISALMNNNKRIRTIHGFQQQGSINHPSQINVANFDPLSSYFDTISRQQPPPPPTGGGLHPPPPPQQNSLLNLDMRSSSAWSKALGSDLSSSAAMISSPNMQPFSNTFTTTTNAAAAASVNPPPAGTENNNTTNNTSRSTATNTQGNNNLGPVARNPKKRSRASRRAPTTVLTTDTTNFRAMVQEFTGIPAPPFTSSSLPFSRNSPRFDLYGTTTTPSPTNLRSNNIPLDSSSHQLPPAYLRRPFPQKVQLPPPPAPPPSLPFLSSTSSAPSSSPLLNSTSSMVDLDSLPNHLLLSSSLLQQKFPPTSNVKIGGMNILDQFGQLGNPGSLSGLPGLISSDQTTTRNTNTDTSNPMNRWDHVHGNHPNFHGEKGTVADNIAAAAASRGGEGMMESWVCSSD